MSAFLRTSARLRKLYIASRQVLRYSHVNKQSEFLTVTPEIQQRAFASSSVLNRNLANVVVPKYENEEQSQMPNSRLTDEFIDTALAKIDSSAKRTGYVLKKDVDAVFRRIQQSGSVSSIQGLYLIRCCSSLLCFEPPTKRIEMVHNIWNKLHELGVPMDASHYNALLKCYLENEHQFSPPEFLAAMENKGVIPNRVTYQRIIEKYCHDGDLSGASAILEHMKEKEFPINEGIFNSLVLGHARSKDMEGAVNMLDVMRKSQLEPTPETYTALACGFAENQDFEGFGNILYEAEEKQLQFSGLNYLQMILSLAGTGNTKLLEQIMAKVNFYQFKSEAINGALILISRGFDDAAYRIIGELSSPSTNAPLYTFMKGLAVAERPFEKLLAYCEDIYNNKVHVYIYEDTAKALMLHGKEDDALKMLKEMKNVGRQLRCHYFFPVFARYHKTGNTEGIWSTLKFMSDLGIPADMETFLDFALPYLDTSNPEEIISKVKEQGQSDAVITDALFLYYCIADKIAEAVDFYKTYKPRGSIVSLVNTLASSPHQDAGAVVRILKEIQADVVESNPESDVFGLFLSRLVFYRPRDIPFMESVIREYTSQGIRLASYSIENVCDKLRVLAPEFVRLVRNLELNVILDRQVEAEYIPPSEMSIEQLEQRLVQLRETGGNLRPVLRHLLSMYSKQKNLERVLQVKAELDAMEFTFSPAAYALLLNLFVSYNNLEEALKYKKVIEEQYPHFKLDGAKGIDLVTLMIKCDKADDAIEFITKDAKDWVPPRFDDLLAASVRKALHAAADSGNVELTRKLFDMLVLDLKLAPVHLPILEPLIKVHFIRDEADAAIEEYRKCVVNYNTYPSRNYMFRKFVSLKDPARLQKVVDISTAYGGKDVALHELACAFVESGCMQEARKVIQTLGTRADMKYLETICYRLFKQNKVTELEQFVSITKDLYHIDRDQLYAYLLNYYTQTNDYQAALEMWNAMQEENVQPTVVTLQKLADLLEKNNQPVPFVVPFISATHSNSELLKCLHEKDEVKTVDILRRMKKGDVHSLTSADFTKIVEVLLEKKYLREIVDIVQVMSCILNKPAEILKPIAQKYGEAGDVESLKLLYDCMPDFAHRYMSFNANFFIANISSGQPETLLSDLEQNLETSKKLFSAAGFLKLLGSYPELFERAVKLADVYADKEKFFIPRIVIWLHYLLHENYEEADKLYMSHAALIYKADFPFVRIMQAVRATHNEKLGRKLVSIADDSLKVNIKYRAYSCLLDVLVQKEKLEDAVELIKEANSKGVPTEKLLHPTLISLKKSLTDKGMPVPFEIPFEGDNSSSSSDSD